MILSGFNYIYRASRFIEAAREEAVDVILDAAGYKERGSCRTLVAAGCLVQDQREALADAIPELDALVGLHELDRIAELCGGKNAGGHPGR